MTMWLAMIVLHAAAGVAAFAVGCAALHPARLRRNRWLPALLVWLLAGLVLFMVGAMAAHWDDLEPAARIAFGALTVLGLYMLARARRARAAARHLSSRNQDRYIDDIGFVLVALLNGFVIVTALDLGAPPVAVAPLGVVAVITGHRMIAHAKRDANDVIRTSA